MKTKTISLLLLVTLCLFHSPAMYSQNETDKKATVQVSFIPRFGTNGLNAIDYTNNFSLNMLAGLSKNEYGFALGGLANVIMNNACGVQIAGLGNYIGNEANGVQMGGLGNIIGHDGKGAQFAGLWNKSESYRGAQFAGLMNMTDDCSGAQFAGLLNLSGDVSGCQFAGLVNVAKNVEGAMFAGLINIADSCDYPVGLINIMRKGEKSLALSYSEMGNILLTFRSGGRVLYGILGVGLNVKSKNDLFVLTGGLGAHINCSSKFRINNEIQSSFLSLFTKSYVNHHSYSLLPAFRFHPHFEIFAGPSLNYMESNNLNNKNLFPDHSLWKKQTSSSIRQLYVGYQAGVQVIF